jgi:hypothetical protein
LLYRYKSSKKKLTHLKPFPPLLFVFLFFVVSLGALDLRSAGGLVAGRRLLLAASLAPRYSLYLLYLLYWYKSTKNWRSRRWQLCCRLALFSPAASVFVLLAPVKQVN